MKARQRRKDGLRVPVILPVTLKESSPRSVLQIGGEVELEAIRAIILRRHRFWVIVVVRGSVSINRNRLLQQRQIALLKHEDTLQIGNSQPLFFDLRPHASIKTEHNPFVVSRSCERRKSPK